MKPARVLVVEDEGDLRQLIQQYLDRVGYEITPAASGEHGWAAVTEADGKFDAYLIDLTLPGLRGDELASRILRRDPSAKIILTSGYRLDQTQFEPENARVRFLQKPYSPKQLAQMLDALVGRQS